MNGKLGISSVITSQNFINEKLYFVVTSDKFVKCGTVNSIDLSTTPEENVDKMNVKTYISPSKDMRGLEESDVILIDSSVIEFEYNVYCKALEEKLDQLNGLRKNLMALANKIVGIVREKETDKNPKIELDVNAVAEKVLENLRELKVNGEERFKSTDKLVGTVVTLIKRDVISWQKKLDESYSVRDEVFAEILTEMRGLKDKVEAAVGDGSGRTTMDLKTTPHIIAVGKSEIEAVEAMRLGAPIPLPKPGEIVAVKATKFSIPSKDEIIEELKKALREYEADEPQVLNYLGLFEEGGKPSVRPIQLEVTGKGSWKFMPIKILNEKSKTRKYMPSFRHMFIDDLAMIYNSIKGE